MSITTNNTSLQEILAKVNALPEAGGGGSSGGGVETCTVTFVYEEVYGSGTIIDGAIPVIKSDGSLGHVILSELDAKSERIPNVTNGYRYTIVVENVPTPSVVCVIDTNFGGNLGPCTGNAQQLYLSSYQDYCAYMVTGDCTIKAPYPV
ncbi:MAG: hypothetical protein E7321_08900 [Clostridiales bacterium]|nr:hypothetical protein [Clostridiales bacterium]